MNAKFGWWSPRYATLPPVRERVTRLIPIPALVITMGFAFPTVALAGPITYFVEPVTLLHRGVGDYAIDGGADYHRRHVGFS